MQMNRVTLDGFSSALLAVESFSDGRAVLHGPGGCRNYHTYLSAQCYSRARPDDFERYYRPYFFGQPRIPCTYLDENDYINGAERKIEEGLPIICGMDSSFSVFICSPGAALIGDNITDVIERSGYSDRALAVEESLISQPFSSSYDHTVKSILEWRSPRRRDTVAGTANIIGLPISSNDWEESRSELSSMLSSMGIEVISSPGAGCDREQIDRSVSAEFNIAVGSEYCRRTARFYEKEYGIPTVFCDEGAPIGFDSTAAWATAAADAALKDPSPVLDSICDAKRRCFRKIGRSVYSGRLKGRRFTVCTDSSAAYPLTKWLYGYLGMVPVSVNVDPGADERIADSTRKFLERVGMAGAWGSDPGVTETDYLFTDGHTAGVQEAMGRCLRGVDIMLPSMTRVNFLPRPLYGVGGAMYILDEVFSGL